jgi:hypothetical protein
MSETCVECLYLYTQIHSFIFVIALWQFMIVSLSINPVVAKMEPKGVTTLLKLENMKGL